MRQLPGMFGVNLCVLGSSRQEKDHSVCRGQTGCLYMILVNLQIAVRLAGPLENPKMSLHAWLCQIYALGLGDGF